MSHSRTPELLAVFMRQTMPAAAHHARGRPLNFGTRTKQSRLMRVITDVEVERQFTEFVAARGHALLQVAYALTGDQHAAEDLVQGALAKAFVRWRQIRGEAEPYVRRIVYHDSVSRWRRPYRRAETTVPTPPDRVLPSEDLDL